jgi:hypothetical protein
MLVSYDQLEAMCKAFSSAGLGTLVLWERRSDDDQAQYRDRMRAALAVLPEPALPELAELRAIFEMSDAPTMRVAIRKLYARLEGRASTDERPDWHAVGDGAFARPFGTIRVCIDCGALVAGGPTRCGRCALDARKAGGR